MTSGTSTRRHWLRIAALLLPWTLASANPDPDALLRRLAKPAPATVVFTEVRFSPLLKDALVTKGTMGYLGSDRLDRHVEQPFVELTEIRGEAVRIVREGQRPRTFSLKRAPELRAMLTSFAGILTGDVKELERSFAVSAEGTDRQWTLILKPKDARLGRRLARIAVTGSDAQPACFEIANSDAAVSILLLGDLGSAPLPKPIDRAGIERMCH